MAAQTQDDQTPWKCYGLDELSLDFQMMRKPDALELQCPDVVLKLTKICACAECKNNRAVKALAVVF